MYFVSFYTEGEAIDGCFDLRQIKRQVEKSISPYFEKMFIFNKGTLKDLPDSDWVCNEWGEETDFKNGNKLGYFDFKPFLVDHVLSIVPEGSIVLWHDINFDKYPSYWQTDWNGLEKLMIKLMNDNQSDYWLRFELNGCYVKNFVKNYTVDYLIENSDDREVVKNSLLLNCGQMVFRNSSKSRELVSEWKELCRNKDLLKVTPNPTPHPESKMRGCQEQDVLNCLIYRRILKGDLIPNFPTFNFNWRTLREDYSYVQVNSNIINYMNQKSS
jgi:hypothetical protein